MNTPLLAMTLVITFGGGDGWKLIGYHYSLYDFSAEEGDMRAEPVSIGAHSITRQKLIPHSDDVNVF
ncbi:MAG: hypothetical protein OEZ30_07975 [Candidatus Aminicenantes bacterium]|nr:hypothetical protein [Candidatus Aminicenantes bacterium]